MRWFVATAMVACSLVVVAPAAQACTCASFDARQALAESPAAFVGTVIDRRDPPEPPAAAGGNALVTYRFRVDDPVKGPLGQEVTVRSPGPGAACGISVPAGRSVALLLSEQDGEWHADLCRQLSPERLLRAAQPLPDPDGMLPPDLLIGSTYGVGRSVALRFDGRVAAVGEGQGMTVTVAACPGKGRAVEVFTARHPDGSRSPGVAVRRVATMELEAEYVLADRRDLPEAAACRDPGGREVVVFTRDAAEADGRGRILSVVDGAARLLWEGPAPRAAAFDAGGRTAYLNQGLDGEELVAVDLAPPGGEPVTARPVARLPAGSGPMAPSPDGRWLATVAYAENRASRAVVVDTGAAPVAVAQVDLGDAGIMGEMVWARPDRVVFTPRLRPAEPVRVYDPSLEVVSSWTGWIAQHSTVAGGRLYGVSQGAVRSASILGGPAGLIRELEDALVFAVVDVSTPSSGDGRAEASRAEAAPPAAAPPAATPPTGGPAPEAPPGATATTVPAPTTTTTAPAADSAGPTPSRPQRQDEAAPASPPGEDGDGRRSVPAALVGALAGLVGLALAGGGFAWRERRRR